VVEIKPLSDALAEPLTKAYKVGGFGLAFLVLGAIFLAASAVSPRGPLSYVIAAVGFFLIVVPCYYFYVKSIRPIASKRREVQRSRELIDSVQSAALEMTYAAYELQSLAYKYADDVANLLRVARPAMETIPFLKRIADSPQFDRADWFTSSVVTITERSQRVITDIQRALIESDPTALKRYLDELKTVRGELKELLRAAAPETQQVTVPDGGTKGGSLPEE
jgi:hypothetical protein